VDSLEPELGPFASLYEEWTSSYPNPRDPEIEAQLASMYRDVWRAGDPNEQIYVTYFVHDRKDATDADILLEAIQSPYFRVVGHSAATLLSWLSPKEGRLQHNEQILNACRILTLQHPVEDTLRFGRLRRDDGWPVDRPFQRYERWMCGDFPRDPAREAELLALVQSTWADGDAVDRAYVLNFLSSSRHLVDHLDLLRDGLRAEDERLARTAAFLVWCSIKDGLDLGAGIRELLEDYRDRFPEIGGYAWHALCALDEEHPPPSVPRSFSEALRHPLTPSRNTPIPTPVRYRRPIRIRPDRSILDTVLADSNLWARSHSSTSRSQPRA
jgi:hypothetical protein